MNLCDLILESYTKPGTVLQNVSMGFLQRKEYNHFKAFFPILLGHEDVYAYQWLVAHFGVFYLRMVFILTHGYQSHTMYLFDTKQIDFMFL